MGKTSSRVEEYATLNQEQQALVKQGWIGIENNPQFHGSVFFMEFCEIYPQYTKYFTADVHLPLTFDARTNTKFTIIMETMGYLLLDFHNKPKKLDRIIGYIAMMHKDMSLAGQDMSNFGVSLINYLSATFPSAMTPECLEITSKYMNYLLDQLSRKIKDFQQSEVLENFQSTGPIPCGSWLHCGDNLIYGHTLAYWNERKIRWEERLEEWRIRESTIVQLPSSSSDDEETSVAKSKTEDESSEFAESTARFLESHGIPRTTRIKTGSQSGGEDFRAESGRRFTGSFDRARKREIIVDENLGSEVSSASRYNTPRERRRRRRLAEITSPASERTTKDSRGNVEVSRTEESRVPFESQKIDSSARQRRRKGQTRLQSG